MSKLDIYVTENCWTCEESRRIASRVKRECAHVDVELIDLNSGPKPSFVFAVPTYVLDGRVVSLGNPSWETLLERLWAADGTAPSNGE
jgi:hypothetical protein